MAEQIQILQGRSECFSRDLEVLWIAKKVISMPLGGNCRCVPLNQLLQVSETILVADRNAGHKVH